MYKTGVITDEISQDIETAAKLAAQYRLDALEIRSVFNKPPQELNAREIKQIADVADAYGLKISAVASPFYKCDLDPIHYEPQLEILKRCIDAAHRLGTGMIRGFSFFYQNDFDERLSEIVSAYEKPIELLTREKIMMVLESEGHVYTINAATLKRLLDALDTPIIRALWDPANNLSGLHTEKPFPDGYEIIKPYMAHVHLKDAYGPPSFEAALLGQGLLDVKGQLDALIADGYTGYVVLETHYRKNTTIGDDLLAMPAGEGFSYMGYESTEECLIAWERIRLA